jgi:hypothetical protein
MQGAPRAQSTEETRSAGMGETPDPAAVVLLLAAAHPEDVPDRRQPSMA